MYFSNLFFFFFLTTTTLISTILAHPSNSPRAEITKAGSSCDSKFKSQIYPLAPELSFALEVLPATTLTKDLFPTIPHALISVETPVDPLSAPLPYIANPWEYSFTKQAAFNLHPNGTLMMDGMWCDLVKETWYGDSFIPACPALPTLRKDEGKWEVRSRCVEGVVRLGLTWGKVGKEVWRVGRGENPGHEVMRRVHWGRVDGKKPQAEVYLIVTVF